MNLDSTLEVYAGGPGSGCRGPSCGRPKTGVPEKDYLDRLKKEKRGMNESAYWTRPLDKKLLKIGGVIVDHETSGAETQGYEHSYMTKFGRLYDTEGIRFVKGAKHDCHKNVCKLVAKNKSIQEVTGYALDKDNGVWYRHSWGVGADGKVVETTGSKMAAYYGAPLDKKFEDWVEKEEEKN